MGDVIRLPRPDTPESPEHPSPEPPSPEPLWREVVGRQLREARTAADRTLADVAGDAGISIQYLSEVERGRKEPSSEVLGAIHGALGLSLVDLTTRVSQSLRPQGPLALVG